MLSLRIKEGDYLMIGDDVQILVPKQKSIGKFVRLRESVDCGGANGADFKSANGGHNLQFPIILDIFRIRFRIRFSRHISRLNGRMDYITSMVGGMIKLWER